MKIDYLFFAQIGFGLLTIVCLVFILLGIRHTLLALSHSAAKANKKTLAVAGLLLLWISFASTLALSGFMANFSLAPLNMLPALGPPLVVVLLLTFHPSSQPFIRHLPSKGLLYLQSFRIPVEIFLWWLFLANALPSRMTFEGTNWDILSGLAGPAFAVVCYGGFRNDHKLATIYNLVGLALLLNIVVTGVLSLPTPFQKFLDAPGSGIMATFPVMLLPTFLVPLAYTLHFFLLRKAVLEQRDAKARLSEVAAIA